MSSVVQMPQKPNKSAITIINRLSIERLSGSNNFKNTPKIPPNPKTAILIKNGFVMLAILMAVPPY